MVGWKRAVRPDESESVCRLIAVGWVVVEIRADGGLWVEATPSGTERGEARTGLRYNRRHQAKLGRFAQAGRERRPMNPKTETDGDDSGSP